MKSVRKLAMVLSMAALPLAGCPTRGNPLLEDADVGAVSDADEATDAETAADADAEVDAEIDDAEPDVDHACTQQNQAYCDGACVPVNTKERCGDCDTRCVSFESCHCDAYGDTYRCWSNADSATCEAP